MLLDSNIIIYAALPENAALRAWMDHQELSASIISYVEVLGYHKLSEQERDSFARFFQNINILEMSKAIADKAVLLRQQRKMSLGDSIIAATAHVCDLSLATHNIEDFKAIADIRILDPLSLPAA